VLLLVVIIVIYRYLLGSIEFPTKLIYCRVPGRGDNVEQLRFRTQSDTPLPGVHVHANNITSHGEKALEVQPNMDFPDSKEPKIARVVGNLLITETLLGHDKY
jgi:hypothetical protein